MYPAAWRRAWRSPRFASVIISSMTEIAALALASVVSIRSCLRALVVSARSPAFRGSGGRAGGWLFFWCRFLLFPPSPVGRVSRYGEGWGEGAHPGEGAFFARAGLFGVRGLLVLVLGHREAERLEALDDFISRLLAKVLDVHQLALGLLEQVADGVDVGALQAVVGAHRQLELFDREIQRRGATGCRGAGGFLRSQGRLVTPQQGELAELLHQELGSLRNGLFGLDRAVGPHLEQQAVEV